MDTATYQVRKKGAGGFSVSYDCPHCTTALTAPLTDAGTSKPCPTCAKSSVVPGKANLDRLKAKQEADRRKAELARQQELQKAEQAKQQAPAEKARAAQRDDAEAEVAVEDDELQAFWKTHCPYCYEEIKENAKKCKSCCEFLDKDLRAKAMEQVVARFQPPLNDVFWLVAKFWMVSASFALFAFLLYLIVRSVIASVH